MNSQLVYSINYGTCQDIDKVIKLGEVDINALGENEQTAILMATKKGKINKMKVILEAGIDNINKSDIYGNTPLYISSRDGKKEMVELLLRHGADPNVKPFGLTPTPKEIAKNKMIKSLLEECEFPKRENKEGLKSDPIEKLNF
jgi:ankyrin repeat protein